VITEEIKSIKSERRDLKKFGITMGVVLGLLGGLFLGRGSNYYVYFFLLAAVFLSLGLAAPVFLKPIHKVWMTLSVLLGWLMTRVILTVLFYLVITPIGLLLRLFGKDFLNLKLDRNRDSYWIPTKTVKFERKDYERQF